MGLDARFAAAHDGIAFLLGAGLFTVLPTLVEFRQEIEGSPSAHRLELRGGEVRHCAALAALAGSGGSPARSGPSIH